jgi:hypothetical protein
MSFSRKADSIDIVRFLQGAMPSSPSRSRTNGEMRRCYRVKNPVLDFSMAATQRIGL